MSGMELARKVLEMKPDLPVILCSGYSSKTNRDKAMEVGIHAFLYKPVRKKEWQRVISEIFHARETRTTPQPEPPMRVARGMSVRSPS